MVGHRVEVSDGNLNAELTIGVDREVLQAARRVDSIDELSAARAARADRRLWVKEPASVPLTESGRAAAIATDGCILSISLA